MLSKATYRWLSLLIRLATILCALILATMVIGIAAWVLLIGSFANSSNDIQDITNVQQMRDYRGNVCGTDVLDQDTQLCPDGE